MQLASNFYNQPCLQQITFMQNTALNFENQPIHLLLPQNRVKIIQNLILPYISNSFSTGTGQQLQQLILIMFHLMSIEINEQLSLIYLNYTLQQFSEFLITITQELFIPNKAQPSHLMSQQTNFIETLHQSLFKNKSLQHFHLKNQQFFFQILLLLVQKFLISNKYNAKQLLHMKKISNDIQKIVDFSQNKISKTLVLKISKKITSKILDLQKNKPQIIKVLFFSNIFTAFFIEEKQTQINIQDFWNTLLNNIDYSQQMLMFFTSPEPQYKQKNTNQDVIYYIEQRLQQFKKKNIQENRERQQIKKINENLSNNAIKDIKQKIYFTLKKCECRRFKESNLQQIQLATMLEEQNLNLKIEIVQIFINVFKQKDQIFLLILFFTKILKNYNSTSQKWRQNNLLSRKQQQRENVQCQCVSYTQQIQQQIWYLIQQIKEQQAQQLFQVDDVSEIQKKQNQFEQDRESFFITQHKKTEKKNIILQSNQHAQVKESQILQNSQNKAEKQQYINLKNKKQLQRFKKLLQKRNQEVHRAKQNQLKRKNIMDKKYSKKNSTENSRSKKQNKNRSCSKNKSQAVSSRKKIEAFAKNIPKIIRPQIKEPKNLSKQMQSKKSKAKNQFKQQRKSKQKQTVLGRINESKNLTSSKKKLSKEKIRLQTDKRELEIRKKKQILPQRQKKGFASYDKFKKF